MSDLAQLLWRKKLKASTVIKEQEEVYASADHQNRLQQQLTIAKTLSLDNLVKLLSEFKDMFALKEQELGITNAVQHVINTGWQSSNLCNVLPTL